MATTTQREAGAYEITKPKNVRCHKCEMWLRPGEWAVTEMVRTDRGRMVLVRHVDGEARCTRSYAGNCVHINVGGACVMCGAKEEDA